MKPTQSFIALIAVLLTASVAVADPAPDSKERTVLFVCEHGSVKSLMAASLFNQIAHERGLAWRGIARGITPDAAVPPRIVRALGDEGIDVTTFVPQPVTQADIAQAKRAIVISLPPSSLQEANTRIDRWSDVPDSSNYAAARSALLQHIEHLLRDLDASDGVQH
ncbi:MAG: low molecular weight phosphatase family protein [Povalibacter sp.]